MTDFKKYKVISFLLVATYLICNCQLFAQTEGPNTASIVVSDGSGDVSWTGTGNSTASDDTYVTVASIDENDTTDYLLLTNFGFSIPGGATIDGIEVSIERNASDDVDQEFVQLIKGGSRSGNIEDNGLWPSSDGTTTYGNPTDLWAEAWTVADINAAGFGVSIRVKADADGMSLNIDLITITVHYTSILPIELTSFDANIDNTRVKLTWTTATETNNSHFSVERGTNGFTFTQVAEVLGAGNSSTPINYSTYDENPAIGNNYYRLKQTDFNGNYEYSSTTVVTYATSSSACSFKVNPNPCSEICNVALYGGCVADEFVTLGLYDILGNKIKTEIPIQEGSGFYINAANNLAPGTYIVMGTTKDQRVDQKFIIQ